MTAEQFDEPQNLEEFKISGTNELHFHDCGEPALMAEIPLNWFTLRCFPA